MSKEVEAQKVPLTSERKLISVKSLAMMAFMTVWGFGNVINGYAAYGGIKVIFTWIMIFALYFIPYALMVGEMGSAFKTAGGGVSSWIDATFNKKLAYYAGWTYWVVHMPYISQKPLNVIVASSWAIWGDKRVSEFNVQLIQLLCIVIFLCIILLTLRGVTMVKRICSIAGVAGLVMSLLFILMALSAPMFMDVQISKIDFSFTNLMPTFDWKFLGSLGILVFAVGGCEKISPYVNKVENPGKSFPRGIIFMTVMVVFTAIAGTIALAMMFDPLNPPSDLMTNGAYEAFQKLGEWYGVGNLFMRLYALSIVIANFGVIILSIDAPLRILIESTDDEFIPASFKKTNKNGAYSKGIALITIIVTILLIIPMFGIGGVNDMVKWLIKLNSVCMPMRYLWVFVAYIGLKRMKNVSSEYIFTKNATLGRAFGVWCFILTALACSAGVFDESPFRTTVNILTPLVLLALGLIMPKLAKRERLQK